MGIDAGDVVVNEAVRRKPTREDWLRATFGEQVVYEHPPSEAIGGPHELS